MAQPQAKEQRNSLKGIAVFAGLSPEASAADRAALRLEALRAGRTDPHYLDKSDDVFFLTLGEVRAPFTLL